MDAKDFEKARAYARESLQLNPQWPLSYVVIAEAERELANVDHAIKTLTEAIALDPLCPHPYAKLADLYSEIGQQEKARDLAAKSVELKPNFPDGHFMLGLIFEKLGDSDKAIHHRRMAEEVDPVIARKLRRAFEGKSKKPPPD